MPLTTVDLLPVLGLRVRVTDGFDDLELRGITDDDLPRLAEVVLGGVHDPSWTPFTFEWTDAPPAELPRRFAQYHWRNRAEWSPEAWTLNLGVWHRGELVGVQGITTNDFLVTRTGETGSWLGLAHQGRGLGTAMRRALCVLCFDHLDFTRVTSGYFTDNASSAAVSRKVGYRPNGLDRRVRRGAPADLALVALDPEDFDRGGIGVEVEGLEAFRRSIGLDSD